MKYTIISAVFLILAHHSIGQTTAPKYSNEFLAIGVDARALGMSNAFSSVTNDVTSGYWNPAGLNALEDQYQLGLMHAQYFAGIANYDYIGFATKLDEESVVALSVIRLGIDDIPDTRFIYDANGALNYDRIQFFSAADYAFLISYAKKLKILGGIDAGANAKIIHRTAGNFATAWGYGIDLGFKKNFGSLGLGLMFKDITGTYNTWSHNTELLADVYVQTGNDLPESSIEVTLPRMVLGINKHWKIKKQFGLLVSMDLEMTFDGERNTVFNFERFSLDPKIGMEIDYLKKFFVRSGVGQFQEKQNFDGSPTTLYQPSIGVGLILNKFKLDYAMSDIGDRTDVPYSHIVSIKLGLNDK